MEEFLAPSFSLGFDLDIADLPTEGEEEEEEAERPRIQPSAVQRRNEERSFLEPLVQESEEGGGVLTLEVAREEDHPPPRILKRLRRGPPPPTSPKSASFRSSFDGGDSTHGSAQPMSFCDEIEEFSSPEKEPQRHTDDYPSAQSRITCGSAKFSLLHRGFVRDDLEGKQRASKVASASGGVSTLARSEASKDKDLFPRLTISPIRKINLIDSDSDDSSPSENGCEKTRNTDASSNKGVFFHEQYSTCDGQKKFASGKCQTENFWKDFSPKKNSKIATPALDEFCKDYFSSVKAQTVNQERGETSTSGFSSSRVLNSDDLTDKFEGSYHHRNWKIDSNWDLSSPQPPAYQYIHHIDPRIQKLIRQRLPYFIPLGVKNNDETQQFGAARLDYMSQFSSGNARGKAQDVLEKVPRTNSSKKQNNRRCSNVIKASAGTGSWVNPKRKANIPKDAGKRRVRADARGSGHWFTGQDGRKVYVSRNGQELSGRMAYSEYKKETGGSLKSKKKAAARKTKS